MKFVKSTILATAITMFAGGAYAQKDNVGIGTTNPDQSAILDLSSSTKGLLLPRLSLQQRAAIQNPANGLIVYQTDMLSGFYFYDGKEWKPLTSAIEQNSVAGVDGDWIVGGNPFPVGSTPTLGTYDNNVPLKFIVNNQQSGLINPTNENTFFGYFAGLTSTGGQNVGIGAAALQSNLGGDNNIAIGRRAMYNNTSGYLNVAIGSLALRDNSSGKFNIAIGYEALLSNTGDNNTAIGLDALKNNTGVGNTAIGTEALFTNGAASNNFALGKRSLYLNSGGQDNFALGNFALSKNVSGNNNLALGINAGRDALGDGNVFVGYNAGLTETASNSLYIANSGTTAPLVYGDFTANYLAVGAVTPTERTQAFSLAGGYRLLVKGGVLTEKVKVALASTGDWSDYVFEPNYKRMPLEEVEKFVKENKHLPNVPSADDMVKGGLDVAKTDAKLLEKIEELTLYVIELNKEIQALKAKK